MPPSEESPPRPFLKDFKCKRCRKILARTDAATLFFKLNDDYIELEYRNFPFPCAACGYVTVWRGGKRKKQLLKSPG